MAGVDQVELSAANESSLDYLIYVTVASSAAKSYFNVERMIQQTCITVCSAQSWNIPFPHLTIRSDPGVQI